MATCGGKCPALCTIKIINASLNNTGITKRWKFTELLGQSSLFHNSETSSHFFSFFFNLLSKTAHLNCLFEPESVLLSVSELHQVCVPVVTGCIRCLDPSSPPICSIFLTVSLSFSLFICHAHSGTVADQHLRSHQMEEKALLPGTHPLQPTTYCTHTHTGSDSGRS